MQNKESIIHSWIGSALECDLEDIFEESTGVGLTANIDYCESQDILVCKISKVILPYEGGFAKVEKVLHSSILTELGHFMLKDYKKEDVCELWKYKAHIEKELEEGA